MAVRNWVMDGWRRVSVRNGFEEYDAAIFEDLDLYRAKSGDEIVSQLFHFRDRGDREFALRPEMTPTLARMIAARANSLPRPIKWFSIPRLCRAERPQRGRLREFFQWNIDIVGLDEALADAECIFTAIDFFREVGLAPADMVMKINSRSLLAVLLAARGFSPDRHPGIFAVLDKRDKLTEEAFVEEVEKIAGDGEEKTTLLAIGQAGGAGGLDSLREMVSGNEAAEKELARLERVLDLLEKMGVGKYCKFDMSVVRGLAYYTGVVFEGFGKGELKRAICGGGRYDQLLEVLGGPPMSGVGFGTSDVVVLDLLGDLNRLPAEVTASKRVDCFLIDAGAERFDDVLHLAARLRQAGYAAEFSYRRQGMGKQFKQAASCGAARAVIVGAEYTERNAVAVKNLGTGQQMEMPVDVFLADPLAWPETAAER